MSFGRIFERFGQSAFGHDVFRSSPDSHRFELAAGGSLIERFRTALDRSKLLVDGLFHHSSSLSCAIGFYSGERYLSALTVFRQLSSLEVAIPRDHLRHAEPDGTGDRQYRTLIGFEGPRSIADKLIFGVLASDLGIKPCLWADLYIFDLKSGVLAHPYDDRGMDVTGPNREATDALSRKYEEWVMPLG